MRTLSAKAIVITLFAGMMPPGFFLAGVWHPEGDPGWAIWLAPPGALLILFAAVTTALAVRAR